MNLDERADEIAASIKLLIADALKQGEERAISRMLSAVRPEDETHEEQFHAFRADDQPDGGQSDPDRRRAPKGTVGRLVDRALMSVSPDGLKPHGILEHAQNEFELMVKPASVRGHLRKGASEGKYHEEEGVWRLSRISMEDRPRTEETSHRLGRDLRNGTSLQTGMNKGGFVGMRAS